MTGTRTSTNKKENGWPEAIEAEYERVRPLGEGAFGIVWLAKAKKNTLPVAPETATTSTSEDDDSVGSGQKEDKFDSESTKNTAGTTNTNDGDSTRPQYVAIKQIATSQSDERQYAEREIAILSEIRHPNIIQCLQSVEMPTSRIIVMTLADGPNLASLVSAGGALSVKLARLAARHLISAVAYLHSRGVIHRDIKPENCILTIADNVSSISNQSNKDDWMSNDAFWDDKATFDEWKIVLVDFGFAKALTPAEAGIHKNPKASVRHLVQRGIDRQESTRNDSKPNTGKGSSFKQTAKPGMRRRSSFTKLMFRGMSALGTREFAAPEVQKVKEKTADDDALASHVSDYGLIADAYSIGATIRVLLTGVPADHNEIDFISSNDNLLVNLASVIFGCIGRKNGDDGTQRKKRYKFLDETPNPARELVMKLMKPMFVDRLTVPLALDEPWIRGTGKDDDDPIVALPMGDVPSGNDDPIKCLDCATKKSIFIPQ